MTTDTSEQGLESLIVAHLTGANQPHSAAPTLHDGGAPYLTSRHYVQGDPADYDREYAVDRVKLLQFLSATQPNIVSQLGLDQAGPEQRKFLARVQGEIAKRGVIDVLRGGVKHGPAHVDLFYGAPSPGNLDAHQRYAANLFSVTRQLQYSQDKTRHALDLGLFINGLPIFTFELKNNLTKQTVHDAVEQYKRDRNPRELLFHFGRCVAHFAVDDLDVRFCTHLQGRASWFHPFNQGYNDGAGNSPNPNGLATAYLWRTILARDSLTDILENYAQIVEGERDRKTGKKKPPAQIFPRYHQLDVVRKLLAHARQQGPGQRYLVQHSAGSGKSNSIAWLAHQLVGLERESSPIFDSVIVVTDRIVLDRQIKETIKHFAQVRATVGHADGSGDLRRYLTQGKKIIITTVQKFPYILEEIGDEHRGRTFAILIDEAHSSQSGRTAAQMNMALAEQGIEEEETAEDVINRIMESQQMLSNASYFAFTATPKNKTLEIFGEPYQQDGVTKHRPFHSYTMKQAIQEKFILDVLENYTPVESFYRLMMTVEDDPQFDVKKAQRKLRRYVEGHDHAIRRKAEIMVDHFHDSIRRRIGGKARAMVVTAGIQRAIQYFHALRTYLEERKSPYRAIVAFSGEHEYNGVKVTEASLNGFPSCQIEETFQADPYRFLIVADKFQTGYDEPLLHTMYVDKPLSGVRAVQTLSRLNRAHPQKQNTFVLDFMNDADTIQAAFEPYYRTTILSEETDPNKLHDLQADLAGYQVYTWEDVVEFSTRFVMGETREDLDPILDVCRTIYIEDLDEEQQIAFKSKAKSFVRTYAFLASILPYTNAEWHRLSIFLNFLVLKLPAPQEDDLSRGILETIDMESYRVEVQSTLSIALADEDTEIDPVPTGEGGYRPEPELDILSNIVRAFNEQFGTNLTDDDRIREVLSQYVPKKVSEHKAYRNAIANSDKQNARLEHDRALEQVMIGIMQDHSELFKLFMDNDAFRRELSDAVFTLTYRKQLAG